MIFRTSMCNGCKYLSDPVSVTCKMCERLNCTSESRMFDESFITDKYKSQNSMPKTANWIIKNSEEVVWYLCSNCYKETYNATPFCPYCGCKMNNC